MPEKPEVNIEISYLRRYNLSNYNHKEYAVKLSGTEEQIKEGFEERKNKLQDYLQKIELMVDKAHEANLTRAKLENGKNSG